MQELTPSKIVEELDKYIIGQTDAKRAVAIALRNRWRRQQIEDVLREEILPNNIILIGPTGVGKTEISRRLAKLAAAPFVKVEASKFTEVGYVGRDVESMVRDLTDFAVSMVKAEKTKEVQSKAEHLADERILDILIPPVRKTAQPVQPVQVQTQTDVEQHVEEINNEEYQNKKTREWMKVKLKKGEMDDKLIEFDFQAPPAIGMQVMGPFGMDDMGINIQEIVGNLMPKKKKKRKTTIAEARQILAQEEATIRDTVLYMASKKVGLVPVMESGKLVGVFSERDLVRRVIANNKSLDETKVEDVMSTKLVIADVYEPNESVLAKMKDAHTRHILIIENEKLIGVLAMRDLLELDLSACKMTVEVLNNYIYCK